MKRFPGNAPKQYVSQNSTQLRQKGNLNLNRCVCSGSDCGNGVG